MQISSSTFQTGFAGIQTGQRQIDQAAVAIARGEQPAATRDPASEGYVAPVEQPSVSEELVRMKVAQYQAEASTQVVKTADEVLGTLIDTRA